MDQSTLSLKRVVFGLLSLSALNGLQVGGAAVKSKELRCHRGYGGRCPDGYDCVKASYGPHSTCTTKYGGYHPTVKHGGYYSSPTPYTSPYETTLSTSSVYTSSSSEDTSPTYPADDTTSPLTTTSYNPYDTTSSTPTEYTTSSSEYTSPSYPTDDTTSSGYTTSSSESTSSSYPTGDTTSPGYTPTSYQPSGYTRSSYTQKCQPTGSYGYGPRGYNSTTCGNGNSGGGGSNGGGSNGGGSNGGGSNGGGSNGGGSNGGGSNGGGSNGGGSNGGGSNGGGSNGGGSNGGGSNGGGSNGGGSNGGGSNGGGSNGGGSNGGGSGNGTSGGDTEPGFTPVEGVKRVVERRPINVLQTEHPDVFNMFVLALDSLQKRNESISVSWYQVSGIHGYPYEPWQEPDISGPFPQLGYCTHGSVLFTTWHRPYLVLLEQLLYEEAVRIAKEFTGDDATKYEAAAQDVRIPYWDWALDEASSRIPAVLQQTSITVVKPGSGATQISNPLYHYRFLNPQPLSLFESTTIRSPDANDILAASFPSRRESTYNFFALEDYNQFSSDLENVHGGVHVDVGGDMADVPTAAFDPIFWLHHCQVDRITAMYQATHPGLYLTPGPRSETFSLQGPGPDSLSTALGPFRHADRTLWNSDEIKTAESIFKSGYAYPEVPAGLSTEALRTFTTEKVNQLYGVNTNDPSFAGEQSGAPETPSARREWSANVLVDSEELSGSHRILIYVGPYDENNPSSNNLAGVAAIFTGPEKMPEANRQLNITVPLTTALLDKAISLRPEDAVPALTGELHWAVERVGKSVASVPVSSLSSLQVSVVSHIVEHPQNDTALPVKSDPLTHLAPTTGKVGGLQPGEAIPVGLLAPPSLDTDLTKSTTSATNSTSSARRI
ncbi:MAG: hypothetical protein M1816_005539 [Peltula sp. TS41687]|nr:MAG: hypothetical protein M1816_005539 [Peltula sp. TS41687]